MTNNFTPSQPHWLEIVGHISASCGQDQVIRAVEPLAGGDISQAFALHCEQQSFFVKIHDVAHAEMFCAEFETLKHMAKFCPKVVTVGTTETRAFIVLELLHLQKRGDDSALGEHIATMHQHQAPEQPADSALHRQAAYGWFSPNFIGTTPQHNTWHSNWCEFWCSQRLQPQLALAYRNGFRASLQPYEAKLLAATRNILADHHPTPILLHGDLWSGNAAFTEHGKPIIFDPAAYYGDRETDIAMTELFGGFSPTFYQSYYQYLTKRPGYEKRKVVYNLYHLLNHLNLFGEGYLGQCVSAIEFVVGV